MINKTHDVGFMNFIKWDFFLIILKHWYVSPKQLSFYDIISWIYKVYIYLIYSSVVLQLSYTLFMRLTDVVLVHSEISSMLWVPVCLFIYQSSIYQPSLGCFQGPSMTAFLQCTSQCSIPHCAFKILVHHTCGADLWMNYSVV